ncbi:MAG: lipopolysaccharide assembly protein LapB [Cycloclasticus sp.]|nr:MAG: lipopolysaccharide assembly protein LapB [Cycloclasticus sp.]
MIEFAIMLLPIAAASGWYFASRHYKSTHTAPYNEHIGYFKGLNHLLNEEPDKAISAFVDLLEVDDDTIEIHLALGTLFRQRGEVDKSIRLHQNLIARPQLNQQTRLDVLNELGLDYMRAGLLDRAENIFLELEKEFSHKINAVRQLLSIFQQEHEWLNAIEYAAKLEAIEHTKKPTLLSHLYCELAEFNLAKKDLNSAKIHLKKALKADPKCVRVNVISAGVYRQNADYKNALKVLMKIEGQNINFVSVFIDLIIDCFDKLNQPEQKFKFLANLQSINDSTIVLSRFVNVLMEHKGEMQATAFMREKLINNPNESYLKLFAELQTEAKENQEIQFLYNILKQLDEASLSYQCKQCGFNAVELHWCCPSCKQWGTSNPE